MIAALAFCLLLAHDAPRIVPEIPVIPAEWAETGNRRARRRDAKLARK